MNRTRIALMAVLCVGVNGLNLPAAATAPAEPLPVGIFKNLQAGKHQMVVVYGTSLTATAEWPKAVKDYFENLFPGRVTFFNAAESGEHSDWGVANLNDRVLAKHPDLVFLEFSVNDAATKHNISLAKSEANLDAMVKALKDQNPDVNIVLQTMNPGWDSPKTPGHKKYASDRPHLEQYYDVYRKYAHEHSLPLVDNYLEWDKIRQKDEMKFEQWLPEGLHPIPEASLAVTWENIRNVLNKARTIAQQSAGN